MTSPELPAAEPLAAAAAGSLGAWWRQGARTALLREPEWQGLHATPVVLACLLLAPYLCSVLVERLYIVGPANFYAPTLQVGWEATLVSLWLCWLVVPATSSPFVNRAPSAIALFAMLAAQTLVLDVVLGVVFVPIVRAGLLSAETLGPVGGVALWAVPVAWVALAQTALVWRGGTANRGLRIAAVLGLLLVFGLQQWYRPLRLWYPVPAAGREAGEERVKLTQEVLEAQPRLIAAQLAGLRPERPGVVDVYALTFAPYSYEEVFRKESELVANVMAERFGSEGRSLQLVNHDATIGQFPWATTLNLERAIQRAAALMNRDEDILFIHLTSHGARDGVLSTSFYPFDFAPVTPADLKRWLGEAKVRFSVISVSACYSGSWIAPLAGDGSLVMTAADAEHTSFGCGKGSELTYFGRAMFDEELRRTWSFEQAHAAARVMIERREKEAGKTDGFSNPQISVGGDIRRQLARLAAERAASAPR